MGVSAYEMELKDRDGDLFADIEKVNNGHPVTLRVVPQRSDWRCGRTWARMGNQLTRT